MPGIALFGFFVLFVGAYPAGAATLTLSSINTNAGQTGATLPLNYAQGSGNGVSGAQFELVFPTSSFTVTAINAGPAAALAGKTVSTNTISEGRIRAIVAGLNQTIIGDGVLANILVDTKAGVASGAYVFFLENVVMTGPSGQNVTCTAINGGVLVGTLGPHSADVDDNWRFSLAELLRVIQFFNMSGYHCQSGTNDGYGPGAGDQSCAKHDSDFSAANWLIGLNELLRAIQFFNIGGYHRQAGTDDGFAPGIAK